MSWVRKDFRGREWEVDVLSKYDDESEESGRESQNSGG